MKNTMILTLCFALMLLIAGCEKQVEVEETPKTQEPAQEVATTAEPEAKPEVKTDPAAALAPIPLELPKPMFVGTPENLSGITNLAKPLGKPRPLFHAPEGTTNLALNKPVTSSEEDPIIGTLDMLVDGDKEAYEDSVIELGPFEQWVQIDLEKESDIYAIVFWHFHQTPRVYFDIIVQASNDPDFVTGVTTLFNNDDDNSMKMGVGSDMNYVETSEGKLVDAKGVKARYIKLFSQANNQNDYSHYIEVEVYGK